LTKSLLALYLCTLSFLSLNPWLRPSSEPVFGSLTWDKIDHAIAYGGLSILMLLLFRKTLRGYVLPLMAVSASAAIGILAEYCQAWFTATRQFSTFDAYANGIGAVAGTLGFGLFQSARKIIDIRRQGPDANT
jgi:VanZ family protein